MTERIKDSIFILPPELQHTPDGLLNFDEPPDIVGELQSETEKVSICFTFKEEEEAKAIISMFKMTTRHGTVSRSRMLSGDKLYKLLKESKLLESSDLEDWL